MRSGWIGVLAAVVFVLIGAGVARGQVFRPGDDFLEPGFTTKDLEHAAELFGFDAVQGEIATEMVNEYLTRMAIGVEQMSTVLNAAEEEFQETRDIAIWNDFKDRTEEFEKRKEAITDQLMADLRLLLRPEQEVYWSRFERDLRRRRTISEGGLVSGETVDLVKMLDDLEVRGEARQAIASLEDQYVTELDRALVKRNEVYDDTTDKAFERFTTEGFGDMDSVMEYFRELLEDAMVQAIRVRDINLKYAATIGRSLPPEIGKEFRDAFNELCYPRVYRASTTDRAFETILSFEDLTDEQRAQVLEAQSRYVQSRERLDANWARAIAEQEEERDVLRVMGIEPSTEATRETRTARRELDRTAYEQVLQVLTEEQARRLPPPVRRDRGDD
ncbi:MAG: hypothetical protein ACIAQF_03230 [Phycisphaerales bacterium JB065]